MADQLFIDATYASLADFAASCFRALSITEVAAHDSDYYLGGEYFEGSAGGLCLKVAFAEQDNLDDFRYWITVSRYGPPISDHSYLLGCGDSIARLLAEYGWRVARPASREDFTDEKREIRYLIYVKASDGDVMVQETTRLQEGMV